MGLTIVVPDHDGTRLTLCHAEATVGSGDRDEAAN
jgi:hypothetical protein